MRGVFGNLYVLFTILSIGFTYNIVVALWRLYSHPVLYSGLSVWMFCHHIKGLKLNLAERQFLYVGGPRGDVSGWKVCVVNVQEQRENILSHWRKLVKNCFALAEIGLKKFLHSRTYVYLFLYILFQSYLF